MESTNQHRLLRDRLRTVSPEVFSRLARQRAALFSALDGLREASSQTPQIASSLEKFRVALMGHVALVDAVFDAIGDDETIEDGREDGAEDAL